MDQSVEAVTSERLSARASLESAQNDAAVHAALTERATDEYPAILTVTFQNRIPRSARYQFGAIPPLASLQLDDPERGVSLVLVPEPIPEDLSIVDENGDGEFTVVPDERQSGCWKAIDRPSTRDYFESVDLSSCESFRQRFHILSDPSDAACFPPGTYEQIHEVTRRDDDYSAELTLIVEISE